MNLRIETPDEALASINYPRIQPFSGSELSAGDCLIVCAGFEERALGILKVAADKSPAFSVLSINYDPYIKENREDEIRELCSKNNIPIKSVRYSRENPDGFGQQLLDALGTDIGELFIDVSAMSRLLIIQVIVALASSEIGLHNCSIVYAEAAEYPPSREEAQVELSKSESDPAFSILFLSSGVYDVTILSELSSGAAAGAQTRLIAFPSFDAHHLTAVRAEIQPSRLVTIEGLPPNAANKWRLQAIAEVNRLEYIEGLERFITSTFDYRETVTCLLNIYKKYGVQDRLLISPTGSKMQTVATAIVRTWVRDIQIVYPSPQGFCRPNRYTVGVGSTYLLSLSPFTQDRNDPSRMIVQS